MREVECDQDLGYRKDQGASRNGYNIQHNIDAEEVQPLPKECALGVESFRKAFLTEIELEEKKQLLQHRLARLRR